MNLLITGASGKVGRTLLRKLEEGWLPERCSVRILAHRRVPKSSEGVEVVQGDVSSKEDVQRAMDGVTHLIHLATCKESPDRIMDVSVKGLFWLLEECRMSPTFQRVVLIGGDSSTGHFFYPHPIPMTETQGRTPYPGCYPLSKVLEEVMLEQYYIQYDLDGCCLRAPWIMEKDDFRMALSFGRDVFGVPRWCDLVKPEQARRYCREGIIPVMTDPDGNAVRRNIVHVEDVADAILTALKHPAARQQLFNITMDEPVSYREVADYLNLTRGIQSVEVSTPYYSNWMDNSKAKFRLGWKPEFDFRRLVDSAWDYRRAEDDPREVIYPG